MKKIILLSAIFLKTFFLSSALYAQEICNDGIDNDGDGFVDCYDSDCRGSSYCEDFFMGDDATCEAVPTEFPTFSMKKAWGSANGTASTWSRVSVGDVDGDGIPEVIVTNREKSGNDRLFILNGKDGTTKQSINLSYRPEHGVTMGKIDGVVWFFISGRGGEIEGYAFNAGTGKFERKWNASTGSTNRRPVVLGLADFKGTGNVQLYYKNEIRDAKTGTRLVRNSSSNWENSTVFAPVAVDILDDSECSHCTGLELVAGGMIYAVNLGNGSADNGSLTKVRDIKDASVGGTEFRVKPTNENWSSTSVADFDLDGHLDVIASGADKNGRTTIFYWNVHKDEVKTFRPQPNWEKGAGRPNIADFDGDGKLNITFVSGSKLFGLDENLNQMWAVTIRENTSGFTGTSVFDFNGDGKYEIVYRDEEYLYIINGEDGSVHRREPCRSRTSSEYPVVVDVDGDGATEICVVCNYDDNKEPWNDGNATQYGHVRVYKSDGETWVPSRKVWNQHTYFNVNVNDDLTIPRQQQKHHLRFEGGDCDNSGNNRPLNTFLNQSPYLDIHGCPTYGAPDFVVDKASVVISPPTCPDLNFDIYFKVSNMGDVGFSGTVPVAFYDGDPINQVANTNWLGTGFAEITNLTPGGTAEINLTVQGTGGPFTLYVAFNDSGSNVLPISFPSGSVLECDYDNVFSAAVNPNPFPIVVEKLKDNIKCDDNTPDNGAASAYVLQGSNKVTADYTFHWYEDGNPTAVHTGSIFTGMKDGSYRVEAVHNGAGCSSVIEPIEILMEYAAIGSSIITDPNDPDNVQHVTSCIAPNGALTAYAYKSTGERLYESDGYTFTWYRTGLIYDEKGIVAIGHKATGLEPGSYSVVVVETATGCESVSAHSIQTLLPEIDLSVDVTDIISCDVPGGVLEARIAGAVDNDGDGEPDDFEFRWYDGDNVDVDTDMHIGYSGYKREGLPAGQYTVVAVNKITGCTSEPVEVTIDSMIAQPEVSSTIVHPNTCSGTPNGSITLNISTPAPGSEPTSGYDIEWFSVVGTSRIALSALDNETVANDLGPGRYLAVVTHPATNCTANEVHVQLLDEKQPLSLAISAVQDNTICDPTNATASDFDGAIEVEVEAGNTVVTEFTGYTFTWVNVNTSETVITTTPQLSNIKEGKYTVTVSNDLGCSYGPVTATVGAPDVLPMVSATQTAPQTSCDTDNPNGSLSANVAGNTTDYTFEWFEGNSVKPTPDYIGATVTGLPAGDYIVRATATATGCSRTSPARVDSNISDLVFKPASITENTVCNSVGNGSISIAMEFGGIPVDFSDYTITWYEGSDITGTPIATTPLLSNVKGGDYTVIVKHNDLGCTAQRAYTVHDNITTPFVSLNTVALQTSCDADNPNGALSANVGGNTSDYTFLWFKGREEDMGPTIISTSHLLSDVESGYYTVVVTSNATGCIGIREYYLGEDIHRPNLSLDGDVVHFSSCGTPDGAITVQVSDDGNLTLGHTYTWYRGEVVDPTKVIPGETGPSIMGLTPGKYTVVVTNNFTHCTPAATFTAEVEDQSAEWEIVDLTITPAQECNNGDEINAQTGGIQINAIEIDGILRPLSDFEFEWYVGKPIDPNATFYTDPAIAFTGEAFNPDAGGMDQNHLTNVVDGSYSVVITDLISGCKTVQTFNVPFYGSEEFVLIANNIVPNTICNDPDSPGNGEITLGLTNFPPDRDITDYTFTWYKGSNVMGIPLSETTNRITGLSAGEYTAVAHQNFGINCQIADITITIEQVAQPPVVVLTEPITPNTNCNVGNGIISVRAEKGNPNDDDSEGYKFQWYAGTEVSGPEISFSNQPAPNYTGSLTYYPAGDYTVRVTNVKTGCYVDETYTIEDQRIIPEITGVDIEHQDKCDPSGKIVVTSIVGNSTDVTDYTYTWYKVGDSNPLTDVDGNQITDHYLSTINYPYMGAGNYRVIATTTNLMGCSSSAYPVTVEDIIADEPSLDFEATPNTACDLDFANGSLKATATIEASDPVDAVFTWYIIHSDGSESEFLDEVDGDIRRDGYASIIENVKPGTYKVTVRNTSTGCEATETWTVNNEPVMPTIVSYNVQNQELCEPSGSITITDITGASTDWNDYIFTWYKNGTDDTDIVLEGKNLFELSSTTYSEMGEGNYYVKITTDTHNSMGCASGFYEIHILDRSKDPAIAFNHTPNTACDTENGANGTLKATATIDGTPIFNATFDWFLGQNTTDEPFEGTVNTSGNESEISGLPSGWYTVKVTNNDTGCFTTSSAWVGNEFVYPEILNATIQHQDRCEPSGSITIENAHLSYGNLADYEFTWYRGSTHFTDIIAGVNGPILDETTYPQIGADTYYVTATIVTPNGLGCETLAFTATIEYNVPPLTIAVESFQHLTSCAEENGAASITINMDTDYANYASKYEIKWYVGINTDPASAALPFAEDVYEVEELGAGSYTVHVRNRATSCFATRVITIEDQIVQPIVNISKEDITICSFDNGRAFASLRNPVASNSYEYEWFVGNHSFHPGTVPYSTSHTIDNLSAGDYTLFVTQRDINNIALCTIRKMITIEDISVNPTPVVIEASPLTNCDDTDPRKSNGQLSASVGGNIFDYTFEWYHGSQAIGTPVYTGPVYSGLTDATYTVRATNITTGCYTDASYTVSAMQEEVPSPLATVLDRTNCEFPNGQITVAIEGNIQDYRFTWYRGSEVRNSARMSDTGTSIRDLDIGDYTVVATSIITGCVSSPVTVTVGENYVYPDFEITTINASCMLTNGRATVEMTEGNGQSIIWETVYGWERGTSLRELPAGTYRVTVVSSNGCSTTKDFTIGTEINVFNGVSPNGDNRNDFFEIDCITDFPSNNVKIFNRAGTLVFEMDGYDNATKVFDGKGNRGLYLVGDDLPDGTYFYVIEKNDGSKPQTGYLELLR